MSINVNDWVTPTVLEPAEFSAPPPAPEPTPQPIAEPLAQDPPPQPETPDEGGIDPKMLLGLLGDQNPAMGALLGMMGGDKPDMMALLPLLMQLGKKPEPEPEPPPKLSLNDYTVIS